MLVAAAFDPAGWVDLTFDRAIDIALLDPNAFIVSDSIWTANQYIGAGTGWLITTETVRLSLSPTGPSSGIGVWLTASGDTRIVAVADGQTWPGVTELQMPYP